MISSDIASQLARRYADQDTLFYDGSCPLCAKEMRMLSNKRGSALTLVDIHKMASLPEDAEASMLKRLHFLSKNGKWLTGLDANVAAWANTPLGYALKLCRLPVLKFLSDKVYAAWADSRFNKRYCRVNKDSECT